MGNTMRRFSAKTQDGRQIIGLALTQSEIAVLVQGEQLVIDLEQAHAGLWTRNSEGKREFTQPRNSFIMMLGKDDEATISKALGVDFPSREEVAKVKE